jgi:hypothetical protein
MKLVFRDAEPRNKGRDLPILFYYNMVVALSRLAETESEVEGIETGLGVKIASNSRPCNRFEIIWSVYCFVAKALWHLNKYIKKKVGARGSIVVWGTMLQAGKSRVRFPMSLDFFQFT